LNDILIIKYFKKKKWKCWTS